MPDATNALASAHGGSNYWAISHSVKKTTPQTYCTVLLKWWRHTKIVQVTKKKMNQSQIHEPQRKKQRNIKNQDAITLLKITNPRLMASIVKELD